MNAKCARNSDGKGTRSGLANHRDLSTAEAHSGDCGCSDGIAVARRGDGRLMRRLGRLRDLVLTEHGSVTAGNGDDTGPIIKRETFSVGTLRGAREACIVGARRIYAYFDGPYVRRYRYKLG